MVCMTGQCLQGKQVIAEQVSACRTWEWLQDRQVIEESRMCGEEG
jgi:hypothetical protein